MLKMLTVPFVTLFAPRVGLLGRIRASIARNRAAHQAIRQLAELPPEACRDAGLDAGALLGLFLVQSELPFFMQPGFGRHEDR